MKRTAATVKRPDKHLYQADPAMPPDHNNHVTCVCGLPQRSDVHELADTTEAAAEDRRRLGEHD